MAQLVPSLDELGQLPVPLNDGEHAVARSLALLDDEWTVYVQPRIGLDMPDFVVLHRRDGVCAIEVKDWRPGRYRQNDAGVIEYRDAAGVWHRSPEQPRYQALRYRSTIYDQFFALPEDGGEPTNAVRSVVVLPQFSDRDARALLERPAVTGAEATVPVFGGDGLRRSVEDVVRATGDASPVPASIDRVRQHLQASRVLGELTSPTPLSDGARNIERNPSGARLRRVRGPAGSGKTFGLAARAARLASEGRQVLVVTYNVTLANYLRTLVSARCLEYAANPTLVTCVNFHTFCTRVVQDAERLGADVPPASGLPWPAAIVVKARAAFEQGVGRRFDAVLVDEGQDFTLDWWNLLRHHVVVPGGEMLLVVDPTQDLYERSTWASEDSIVGGGFSGPWTELTTSYRLPSDMVDLTNDFASAHLAGDRLSASVPAGEEELGGRSSSFRRWTNIDRVDRLGVEIGHEVVRLLEEHPHLSPRDMAFLCDYHHDGVAAVRVIEDAGIPVHHIFSRDPDAPRRRRKHRFWPDADGVKGCTVHSFKGWETTALVMGIGVDDRAKRLAYIAMTRVRSGRNGELSYLSVVNADRKIAGFKSQFEAFLPPRAELRVG